MLEGWIVSALVAPPGEARVSQYYTDESTDARMSPLIKNELADKIGA